MFRSHRITRALAIASGFTFLLTATMASAGHDDQRRARRHKVVIHDDYCSARGDSRHDHNRRNDYRQVSRRHGYRNDHRGQDRYERRRDSYTCEPCGHRFESRSRFHRHLSGHHHIPLFALPFVIVRHTLGWIFYG
ncbi:MAG: hypothetical protein JRH01_01440 [Deltaproteobacteria bacterium]|nr:hypothetical protein [Deltaproteobacteria bacterium]MBW2394607.1 hypothetical protein [Deltaproteobacteria bacterium]